MTVIWKPPSIPGAAQFAYWGESLFGFVTQTAFRDGRWRVRIFPHGKDDERSFGAYVRTEAQGKKYVERWAQVNHARIAPAKGRQVMPHEGAGSATKPRKPKGSDDRS